jgi:signal transduction histidine kinase/DNA-binding response OmpR family regulator
MAYLVLYRTFYKRNAFKYISILFPYLCLLVALTLSSIAYQRGGSSPVTYFTFVVGTLIIKTFYPLESLFLYGFSYLFFTTLTLHFLAEQEAILIPVLSDSFLLTIATATINFVSFYRYRTNFYNRKRLGELLQEKTAAEQEMRLAKEEADQQRTRAELATKAKSDFLANMSHEIRTPMNAIIGLNDLLAKTRMNEKQKDYVDKVGNAAKNLMEILNDILDTSKIEAGKMGLETAEFSLDDTLDYLSNLLGKKAQEKGIELVFDKSPRIPPSLSGDSLRLGQVLLNLCSNAVKFTKKGEVVVSITLISRTDTEVRLSFEVRDTGIGMTQEQISRLFTAFSQADASTTRKFGGTGLGLLISKNLVDLMGGTLQVHSEPGIGSLFSFEVSFGSGKEHRSTILEETKSIRGLRALVVEDHAATRQVIWEYAVDLGLDTLSVSSGEEAISTIDESFDLIFMDWKLPGIDGIEAWRLIKEKLQGNSRLKVLFITAFDKDEIIHYLSDEDSVSILTKPIRPTALIDSIIALLGITPAKRPTQKPFEINLDTIRGAKVLLVEDNEINQQVARETLEAEGFWVEIADNGLIAYEKARSNVYDIILMDLHLPELDGIGATLRIRSDPSIRKDLPVIALSADVLSETLQRAKKAGMNDFVTKPIDPVTLFEILKRWIPEGKRPWFTHGDSSAKTTAESITEKKLIEQMRETLHSIHVEESLIRFSGNTSLFREALNKYQQNYEGFAEVFRNKLEKEEYENVEHLLHTLKGVAGQIGARKIQRFSEMLEPMVKERRNVIYEPHLGQLTAALEETRAEIQEFLLLQNEEETPITVKNTPSYEEMREQFKTLEDALENYDVRAEDIYSEMKYWLDIPPWGEIAKSLGKYLRIYDYEQALEISRSALRHIESKKVNPINQLLNQTMNSENG